MFILIILRDVSFLLSGKGNKVTESPATTIIHRVYESPCGIITTYATPWTTLALNNTHTSTLSLSLSCPLPLHPLTQFQTVKHTCGSWESREESQHARASRHQMVKWRLLFLLLFLFLFLLILGFICI